MSRYSKDDVTFLYSNAHESPHTRCYRLHT